MPRPRTPSNVLELKGSFKKHPDRRRKVIKPVQDALNGPPPYLTPEQAAVWREILHIAPPGVVTATDAMAVEVLACLMSEFRQSPELFTASRIAQLMSLFGRFGLTPSDREKISIKEPDTSADPFAEFRA